MKLPRRQFLHLAAGVAALPAVSRVACKPPVRWIVGLRRAAQATSRRGSWDAG
jgi:hypothetical protein